ncbi:MAG: 2OG-Fe(II) oxygenase [Candidatus Bathyarchaeia archaeon]
MNYVGLQNNPWERATVTYPYVWWDGAFTDEELQQVIDYCEDQGLERATVLGTDAEEVEATEQVRRCDIKFHNRNADTAWFFDRMNTIASNLNNQFYGFDLNGYDAFQYTSYNSEERGTYHWHMDTCLGNDALPANMTQPRKLSLTLLLNDDFEGGEFMVNLGNESHAQHVPIPKGRVIAFPSFVIHSVKPVTKGYRKSAVIWVTGPKFR